MNKPLVDQYCSNDAQNLDNQNPYPMVTNSIHLILHNQLPNRQIIQHLHVHDQQYLDNRHMFDFRNLDKFRILIHENESKE